MSAIEKQGGASSEMAIVVAALRTIRLSKAGGSEEEICVEIANAFSRAGVPFRREFNLGSRSRADFWIQGIVVEVKKDRPPRVALLQQVARYASIEHVLGVVVVLERSVPLPQQLHDKPIACVSLNASWGIAL